MPVAANQTWNIITDVQSRQDLVNYALRALGAPVINIELDQTQINDRINEALEFFLVRYYGMIEEAWFVYTLTDTDIANKSFRLPRGWSAVIDLLDPFGDSGAQTADNFDNLQYRLVNSDFFNFAWTVSSDMVTSYHLFQEKINLLRLYFNPETRFRFNQHTGMVTLYRSAIQSGQLYVVHGYRALDPSQHPQIFGDPWLKKYVVALLGRQWGANISKYDGIQLPGGVTMNGKDIYDRYDSMVDKLKEEYMSSMEQPPAFFME